MRTFILFLAACFTFVHTELHEVLTIPVFIQHYLEHKGVNPNQNILDFLAEHYTVHKNTQQEDSTHKKLPFQHDSFVHIPPYTVQSFYLAFSYYLTFKNLSFILSDIVLTKFIRCKGIWQPPKY